MKTKNSWVVYACHNNTDLLYVGHGKIGREKHVNSGTSHVYELNRDHFLKNNLKVSIVKNFHTKADANEFENEIIRKCLPKYNNTVKKSEEKISLSYGWLDSVNKSVNSLDLMKQLLDNKA